MKKLLFVFFFFIFFFSKSQAQDINIRVRVLDGDSLKAIPFSNIQLRPINRSVVTDENGFAMFKVKIGDTLIVTSLGYYSDNYIIYTGQLPPIVNIKLKAHNYTLSEATIKGIRTPEDLKKAILRMRIQEDPDMEIIGIKSFLSSSMLKCFKSKSSSTFA